MVIKFDNLSEKEFLEKFLAMVNFLTEQEKNISPAEIKLLVEFLVLPEEIFKYQRFGSLAKLRVLQSAEAQGWNLTKININNKLYSLIQKGFLRRDEDGVVYVANYLLRALAEFRKNNKLEITLTLEGTDDNKERKGDNKTDGGDS